MCVSIAIQSVIVFKVVCSVNVNVGCGTETGGFKTIISSNTV
jgi:hypothetical protein